MLINDFSLPCNLNDMVTSVESSVRKGIEVNKVLMTLIRFSRSSEVYTVSKRLTCSLYSEV